MGFDDRGNTKPFGFATPTLIYRVHRRLSSIRRPDPADAPAAGPVLRSIVSEREQLSRVARLLPTVPDRFAAGRRCHTPLAAPETGGRRSATDPVVSLPLQRFD
jgi:hypothetical protein